MGTYTGVGRSNTVTFSDIAQVKAICRIYGCSIETNPGVSGWIVFADDDDYLTSVFIEDEHVFEELQALKLMPKKADLDEFYDQDYHLPHIAVALAPYIGDDEVFIWTHVGHEKLRYLSGYSTAVNKKGKQITVSLNDIYDRAKRLTNDVSKINID